MSGVSSDCFCLLIETKHEVITGGSEGETCHGSREEGIDGLEE